MDEYSKIIPGARGWEEIESDVVEASDDNVVCAPESQDMLEGTNFIDLTCEDEDKKESLKRMKMSPMSAVPNKILKAKRNW